MASAESFPDVGSRVTLCTSCGKVVVAAMKKSPASAGKKVAGSRLELQLAGNRDRDASIFLVGMRTAKQGTLAGQTFTTLFLQSLGDGDGYGYVGVRERASSVWLMLALVRCGPVPHSQAPSSESGPQGGRRGKSQRQSAVIDPRRQARRALYVGVVHLCARRW
jgi:hypothetical protein